jgi:hypothetical protein
MDREGTMADRRSLGIIGWIFGGLTAIVILVGFVVVKGHVDGGFTIDRAQPPMVSATTVAATR